ncbi:ribonucleoside-triphosphate reductase, adenosylcobalamin-dependent [Clostridium sp.]|uniref:ribonucleoside-triphosphate reductase, adenosylcobalamin-dependent n=1 Tax=Clostridium sp. TaxID=1506 RepID=UPI00262E9EAC|nr:ribonucleoside-triphosphate reductase, adenosylcobalamin-dependent [Clostridium sp.]
MIKIISNEGCTNCDNVKKYLDNSKIDYKDILINNLSEEEKEDVITIAKLKKQTAYPILFDNDIYTTFTEIQNKYGKKVIKRDLSVVLFNKIYIVNAIENAMFETGEIDNKLSEKIADDIMNSINDGLVNVETIQDMVEKYLIKYNRNDISERYSTFRKLKAKERKIKEKLPNKIKLLSDNFLSKYKHIKPPFTPLGEFVYYRTYSRWIPEFKRREFWWETVARVVEYNCNLLPTSIEEAEQLYDNMFNLRQMPSGRSLWIAGTKSAEEYPLANFNCSFVVINDFHKFVELFHALLVGAGVGFRVLFDDVKDIAKYRSDIEIIHKPYKSIKKRYRDENTSLHIKLQKAIIEIGDSKDGWTKALETYFNILTQHEYKNIKTITFNYDNVRPFGEKLVTFGGYASGHQSIQNMFMKIHKVLVNRIDCILKPIDCIDIANIIAQNVIVGGVRRSAEIALIDANDKEAIGAKNSLYTQDKNGIWSIDNNIEHRRMSNNTIWYRQKPTREQLHWNIEQMRYSGEPGFANEQSALRRNPNAKGLNPCAEVILDDRQTCNLSVVNLMAFVNEDNSYDKEALFNAQKLSARLSYRMTNVNLEMHEWDIIQKRDRLLGCDITGDQDFINATHMSNEEWNNLIKELLEVGKKAMREIAKENNMNESILITAGKPNGTLALLPTVSAGIHYSHSPYYIRRVRISASDPLCKVVEDLGYPVFPEVGQTLENCDTKVIEFPVKSPEGKTKYDVSAIEQLENYRDIIKNYVEMNQSITVTVRNNEWEDVEQWVWDNWDEVVAISFLSLDDNYYQLLPYEATTKEDYEKRVSEMKPFDPLLIQKYEKEETEFDLEVDADCSTGACPIR